MNSLAYIKGVLNGDGYIDWSNKNPRICLDTVDKNFAKKFAKVLENINLTPRITKRVRKHICNGYNYITYYIVIRATSSLSFLKFLTSMKLETKKEKIGFISGMFDSEGCLYIKKYQNRTCYNWVIANSNVGLLKFLINILKELEIKTTLRVYPNCIPYIQIQNKMTINKIMKILGGKKYFLNLWG